MSIGERIHSYWQNPYTVNDIKTGVRLEDKQKLIQRPESSELTMDDDYNANTIHYIQSKLSDEIKHIQLTYQCHIGTMYLNL
jgi:hypothetical protein